MSHHGNPKSAPHYPWLPTPGPVLLLGLGYLAVAWLVFFAVDVGNFLGARDWLEARVGMPVIWYHLTEEGSVHELFQWAFLGGLGICAAVASGVLMRAGAVRPARFWGLFAVAGVFMLIEDTGDPRFYIAALARDAFGDMGGRVAEAFFLLLIGLVPLLAIALYGRSVAWCRSTVVFLAVGIVSYALAGGTSALSKFGTWYAEVGGFIDQVILRGALLPVADYGSIWTNGPVLMDYWLEESLELVGAMALLAACLAYYRSWVNRSRVHPESPERA